MSTNIPIDSFTPKIKFTEKTDIKAKTSKEQDI